ncbi:cholinesterase 2-like [Ornithodoros turicata]|uniref:cholinesterase 2-like n=1 Tax=Ornithodoros turicata TaxID=34597 RepID=UPI003138CF3C
MDDTREGQCCRVPRRVRDPSHKGLTNKFFRSTTVSHVSHGTSRMSEVGHSFWSWRSVSLFPHTTVLNHVSTRDLACSLFALLLVAILLLFVSFLLRNLWKEDRSPTEKITIFLNGPIKLEGYISHVDGIDVQVFLGVPYAGPTVRFRRPSPVPKVNATVLDATQMPWACPQDNILPRIGTMSEDCLTLSIWTPKFVCTERPCVNRTVVFFLHGGFFQTGSNSDYYYDGSRLSAAGNLVVVAPNYRLGAFGFLNYNTSDAPGNMGILDQREALFWVRDRIGEFGGDATKIVLMGHESGAASIAFHLHTAHKVLHFKRVILLSASPFSRYPDDSATPQKLAEKLATALSCPLQPSEIVNCLRTFPHDVISRTKIRFFPTFTGQLLSAHPITLRQQTKLEDMDVMLGYTEMEGLSMSKRYLPFLTSEYLMVQKHVLETSSRVLTRMGFDPQSAIWISEQYSLSFANRARNWVQDLLSDILVVCPVQYYAEYLAITGNRVQYYYAYRQNATECESVQYGYVTDHIFRPDYKYAGSEANDFSRKIVQVFADFANNLTKFLPRTVFSAGCSVVFGQFTKSTSLNFRKEQCSFLRPFYMRKNRTKVNGV